MNTVALEQALEQQYGVLAASVGRLQFESAIGQRATLRGLTDDDWLQLATEDRRELHALLELLPISESWLQRDPEQFEQIRSWLGQRDTGRSLRVLCAPCASGEEAWSLAALLHECGWRSPRAQIHALDINGNSLQRARSACYTGNAWRGSAALPWWLACVGDGSLQVTPELAPLLRFEQANLLDLTLAAGQQYDLLLSRNFLIYLGTTARAQWLQQLLELGTPGCLWISARSEPLAMWDRRFAMTSPGSFVRADLATDVPPAVPPMSSRRSERPRRASAGVATVSSLTGTANADPPQDQQPSGATPSLSAQLAAAVLALQGDQLEQAERLLRGALFLDRNCEEALLHLAALCQRHGHHAEAQRLRERLRRLDAASA